MIRLLAIVTFLFIITMSLSAQEDVYEEMLREKVIYDEPVYKPVIGIGTGVINFHGDVRNNFFNPYLGDKSYKFSISTYVDAQRNFKANFFLIYGSITGNYSTQTPSGNLNFKTDLVNFGINGEYTFGNLLSKSKWIQPFVSVGIGNLQFTPKGDLKNSEGIFYNYWSDGTIRNIPESEKFTKQSQIIQRDFIYETDLRKWEKDQHSLGNYSRFALSVPLDAGFDFKISSRVSCRLGTSIHFTMSDFIDNVSYTGTSTIGKKGNDKFSFSYFSIQLDLFSQPKEQFIDRMFVELEFDDVMFDDEDGDFVLDPVDECPGTPYGVIVDMRGCPIDTDGDGVPDYLDLEADTHAGNWVDQNGVTVTSEQFMALMLERADAMSRKDVEDYLNTIGKGYVRKEISEIPAKFKLLDTDLDGYISFEELLKAIDDYFNSKLSLSVKDLYELNNFFFTQ
jgi:Ca2+-binding EF-hand superfamily protein